MNKEVEETLCWGIDPYTRKNIFYLLPDNLEVDMKFSFIQFSLMKALNLQKDQGWNIEIGLLYILEHSLSKWE